jgi:hypothetical protein
MYKTDSFGEEGRHWEFGYHQFDKIDKIQKANDKAVETIGMDHGGNRSFVRGSRIDYKKRFKRIWFMDNFYSNPSAFILFIARAF